MIKTLHKMAFAALLGLLMLPADHARAEVKEVRIGGQPGLPYLPFTIMERFKLIEKHAATSKLGELKAVWITRAGPAELLDAMLGGRLDMIGIGIPALVTLYDKTAGTSREVKGLWALQSMPFYLVTNNPQIKTLRDFTDRDKIAVPSVKVSSQAIALQMAAAQAFGQESYAKLDPLTISRGHPDATTALMSGSNEITAHFSSSPFYYFELADPKIHKVLTSYEVTGGEHTNGILASTTAFYTANPEVCAVVRAAEEEANAFIKANPREAAQIYIDATNDKSRSVDEVAKMVADPEVNYTTTPLNIMKIATFMYQTGSYKNPAKRWQDLFHPSAHDLPGS
ncbi:ABC transporter substrate-binding protein [Aquabacter sp. CN5-332]|uniref:ABC transporter substrate-binding protein n=1 Tax=Aquabacter sp. CN5-332 TaxID=3156608 RepID=UPI0032B3B26B